MNIKIRDLMEETMDKINRKDTKLVTKSKTEKGLKSRTHKNSYKTKNKPPKVNGPKGTYK